MPELYRLPILENFLGKTCLLTKSGTVAIWLALVALGLREQKIILPANSCFVMTCAILLSGNTPLYVDIDDSCSIDPYLLETVRDERVGAVIYPYMYGNTGNVERIRDIAASKGWVFIEDIAQALGAKIGNEYAGSYGDIAIGSFGIGKIIDRGTGGILCFNQVISRDDIVRLNGSLAIYDDRLRVSLAGVIGSYVSRELRFRFEGVTEPFRTEDIVAHRNAFLNSFDVDESYRCSLNIELSRLDEETDIRTENAARFQKALQGTGVDAVMHRPGATYWRQNILVREKRDELLEYLKTHSIKASVYFPPINRFFTFQHETGMPNAEAFYSRVINLWSGKETTETEIIKAAELIDHYSAERGYAQAT